MRMFVCGKDRSNAMRRRFTGNRFWLLWPFQRYILELSAFCWFLDRTSGTDLGRGFWAWVAPTERRATAPGADEIVDLVDNL